MQRLLLDQSPLLILACLALAAGFTYLLYRQPYSWSIRINRMLSGIRFILIFLLSILLLGPVLKLILNRSEDPAVVILVDNSSSIRLADSVRAMSLLKEIRVLGEALKSSGYAVSVRGLDGKENPAAFDLQTSDIDGALRRTASDFESSNLATIVLVSDGIYNSGLSPAFQSGFTPLITVGVGDSIQRPDLRIRALSYNKVAYQGNTFPIRAEVLATGIPGGSCRIQLMAGGKVLASQVKTVAREREFFTFDFQVEAGIAAGGSGIRRYEVTVSPDPRERNKENNTASAFVEVVDSRKKILVIAPAPHPDIKALRAVIGLNGNYEFHLHIPGVKEADPALLQPGKADLVILNQSPDNAGITLPLAERFLKSATPAIVIIGQQSGLGMLGRAGVPISFESAGQWDEVSGIPSTRTDAFELPRESASLLARVPPLVTPFGKFSAPADAREILLQRIGSVQTNRPLVMLTEQQDRRMAIIMGEGIWKWRLKEFDLTGKTVVFDEIFSRLIQYTSTADDRRLFRCFPSERSFSGGAPVQFESQVFNDVYQLQFGIPVKLDITDEAGKKESFEFNSAPAGRRFSVGLPPGVYRYRASIVRGGKTEEDKGIFSVSPGDAETLDLTADMGMMRKLASANGGKFFPAYALGKVADELKKNRKPGRLHSEETFRPLIDLPLFFVVLLLLVSVEWFTRKFMGGY